MEQSTKLCECGCGEPAPLMQYNDAPRGFVKGQPFRFVRNHHTARWSRLRRGIIDPEIYREEDRGFITPCWIWLARVDRLGYPQVYGDRAHRLAWRAINGQIPDGLELDHLCRQRSCIRPDHLEAVTHQENCQRGSTTKMTREIFNQIWDLREKGLTHRQIGSQVGLSKTTVGHVLGGKLWTHWN